MTAHRTLSLLLCGLAVPALVAAQMSRPTEDSVQMDIGNDRYILGGAVTTPEAPAEDLLMAGGDVTVTQDVPGDVLLLGGDIDVTGTIGDDVRVAGGQIRIDGAVAGDVVVAGGEVRLGPDATVGGSVLIYGGSIVLDGDIAGRLHTEGGTVTLNGTVEGDARIAAETITMGSAARIGGNLRYWQKSGQTTFAGVNGTSTFDPALERDSMNKAEAAGIAAALLAALSLISLLTAALSILVFQLAAPTILKHSAKQLRTRPGMSLLIGLLTVICMPIVGILLMISVIGLPLGIALLLMFVVILIFLKVVAALVLAGTVEQYTKQTWHPVGRYFAAVGIFIALRLLGFVPVIGWTIVFLLTLAALGALLQVKFDLLKKVR